ncbi:preprotein translocase subunit SecG [Rheinheimera baltica]|uniref:Protein-export membrane protein SecG n=1 Tax=Rheinheimera baltica TaxID=67576 RepID=A0ABT9HZH2_9GAMM|nr:preprotein translocase subunit SecG [Rheinheimera baltica]MDP5136538.1 preprotein translocase subunit SecG [Rheinheimera baltica]MDP5141862.1 preprotein translocase subunit SecG [Rheinheimera baltica]MDP5191658.1 preprotein translocase subunit SecG [Rheinheimera baltica]
MYEIFIVVYLLVAMALIGLVLIQHGKGADMGASFGAGASATVFGSSGTGNFLTKTTTILATIFFVLSIVLGNYSAGQSKKVDEWQDLSVPTTEQVELKKDDASDIPVGN